MQLSDFDYNLPKQLIAQKPANQRDQARLLVMNRETGDIAHRIIKDLKQYFQPGDLIVTNSSKVIPARLFGKRETGGSVELLLLTPQNNSEWIALIKPGRRIKANEMIKLPGAASAEFIGWENGVARVRLNGSGDIYQYLEKYGLTPYPPYIKADEALRDRYQTVYAKLPGSVAAPTAGLHFTEELIASLKQNGVEFAEVTLHVGLGTFRPVSVENPEKHKMHSEYYDLSQKEAAKINQALIEGRRIIAVGTTSVRVLETATKLIENHFQIVAGSGQTDIFIYPGYSFKVIQGLLTNFHLPKSSLIMLVAAFAGRERVVNAYSEAVRQEYRFYSFGDAMLII